MHANAERYARWMAAHPGAKAEYDAKRARMHTLLIQSIKLDVGCVDCGYTDDPAKLHFDHRPGTIKLFNISTAVNRSRMAVMAEIDKCDVRCASCHIRRHNTERASVS